MTGFSDLSLTCPLTLAVLVFMNNLSFMLSSVEHEIFL